MAQAITRQEPGLVTGLFSDRENAESAYRSLRLRGYTDDEINVIMSDATRDKYYVKDPNSEIGTKAGEGAGVGGAVGGALGAILGGIAAIGTNLVLPGLGLIVWGPVAAAIAGAGAGGFAGGLVGALVGWACRKNVHGSMKKVSSPAVPLSASSRKRPRTRPISNASGPTITTASIFTGK